MLAMPVNQINQFDCYPYNENTYTHLVPRNDGWSLEAECKLVTGLLTVAKTVTW